MAKTASYLIQEIDELLDKLIERVLSADDSKLENALTEEFSTSDYSARLRIELFQTNYFIIRYLSGKGDEDVIWDAQMFAFCAEAEAQRQPEWNRVSVLLEELRQQRPEAIIMPMVVNVKRMKKAN